VKLYLCDEVKRLYPEDYGFLTRFINAESWKQAEQKAEEKGLVLVGQFLSWTCEKTGQQEYIH
jgi:hypothetical protein